MLRRMSKVRPAPGGWLAPLARVGHRTPGRSASRSWTTCAATARRSGPGGERAWDAASSSTTTTPWVRDYRGLWGLDTQDAFGGERAPAGPRYERDGASAPPGPTRSAGPGCRRSRRATPPRPRTCGSGQVLDARVERWTRRSPPGTPRCGARRRAALALAESRGLHASGAANGPRSGRPNANSRSSRSAPGWRTSGRPRAHLATPRPTAAASRRGGRARPPGGQAAPAAGLGCAQHPAAPADHRPAPARAAARLPAQPRAGRRAVPRRRGGRA